MNTQEKSSQRRSGRPPLVSDDEVIKLGLKIEAEKEYVSGNSIKRRLVALGFDGGGNPNRYDEVWNNYLRSRNGLELDEKNKIEPYIPDDVIQAIDATKKSFEEIISSLIKISIESTNKIHIRQSQEAENRAKDAGIRCAKIENEAEEAINASQRVINELRVEIEELSKEIKSIRELNYELLITNKLKSEELLEYKSSIKTCEIKIIHLEMELGNSIKTMESAHENKKIIRTENSTLRDENLILKTKYEAAVELIEKLERDLAKNRIH